MYTPHANIQHSVAQQQRKWRNIFWAVMALLILFQALDLWASEPQDSSTRCQPDNTAHRSETGVNDWLLADTQLTEVSSYQIKTHKPSQTHFSF